MKKILMALIVLIAAVSICQAQVIQMKLGHFAADSHPGNLASKMFAEAVEKRTNGADQGHDLSQQRPGVPAGSPGAEHPGRGGHEPAHAGTTREVFQEVQLRHAPFVFNNYAQADKVLDGKFIPWAVPDLDKAGLVFLSNWEWGFRNLTNSKRPVNVPADVKGLKVRTPPELPTQAAMEALGAVVATINFNELQMALKTGGGGRPGEPDRRHLFQQDL